MRRGTSARAGHGRKRRARVCGYVNKEADDDDPCIVLTETKFRTITLPLSATRHTRRSFVTSCEGEARASVHANTQLAGADCEGWGPRGLGGVVKVKRVRRYMQTRSWLGQTVRV